MLTHSIGPIRVCPQNVRNVNFACFVMNSDAGTRPWIVTSNHKRNLPVWKVVLYFTVLKQIVFGINYLGDFYMVFKHVAQRFALKAKRVYGEMPINHGELIVRYRESNIH